MTRGICDGFATALFGLWLLSEALQRFQPSSFSQTMPQNSGRGECFFGAVPRVRRRDDL